MIIRNNNRCPPPDHLPDLDVPLGSFSSNRAQAVGGAIRSWYVRMETNNTFAHNIAMGAVGKQVAGGAVMVETQGYIIVGNGNSFLYNVAVS